MDKDDRRRALEDAKAALRAAEAEAEAARRRVREMERGDGITKRDVAKAGWVAPLVMAVNMPDRVFAQNGVSPVITPTQAPGSTSDPTSEPPTEEPTPAPIDPPTEEPTPAPNEPA